MFQEQLFSQACPHRSLAHLYVPVDDFSSVESSQPPQDLPKQPRAVGGGYPAACLSHQRVGVPAVRPLEDHDRRPEDRGGKAGCHPTPAVAAAAAVVGVAFFEDGRVNEDIVEPHEVAEVYVVAPVDAVGIEAAVQPQARDELHVRPRRRGVVVRFVEKLDGNLRLVRVQRGVSRVWGG